MAGRERIAIGANDTLEGVLDRLRASRADELVLDVDERSPLLFTVKNLEQIEETAQRGGARLTIASTSSRVLNAARVFGLPVRDLAAAPALGRTRPDPNARLLAGEPLGDAESPVRGGVAVAEEPAPTAPEPRVTTGSFQTVTLGEEMATAEAAPDEVTSPPLRRRLRRTSSPEAAPEPRLDPYGQPYDEEATAEDDEPTPPRRRGRRIEAAPSPEAAEREDEGWESDLTADRADYDDPRESRPGLLDGWRGFWADVRERVAARRQPALEEEYEDEAEEEATTDPGEEGWDEPPYRTRKARAIGAAPEPEVIAPAVAEPDADEEPEISGDTGELPPPIPVHQGRTIRPLERDRFDPHRQPTARLRPLAIEYEDEADEDDYVEEYPARRAAGGLLIWALILLLAVGLVATAAGYVLVPRATVTLTARTGSPEIGFNVVVAEIDPNSPEGQPTNERIVVPARRVNVPVSASGSVAATGTRLEPDITAGGPVILTNASTSAVTVPKGAILTATDGREYVTQEAITVGPIDPFASSALGTATVKVAASMRGGAGNAAVGAVRGQLASGIFYNNRDAPIAGGSDRRIATITKQDLANAQAVAEASARGKWQAAVGGAVPAGTQALAGTAGLGAFAVEFNAKEGADATSVTATVTATATTLVFTPSEIEAQARAEAERRIALAAPAGESILPGSTQLGTPQLAQEVPGTLTYRMTATARSRAAIGSQSERDQLATDLAHLSDDEAHDVLARLPGVSSATIDYDTGPFPRRMPWLASHIRVEVAER